MYVYTCERTSDAARALLIALTESIKFKTAIRLRAMRPVQLVIFTYAMKQLSVSFYT